jgi:hypothetical protein
MKKKSFNTAMLFLFLSNSGMVVQASDVPDYMKPFTQNMEKPIAKEKAELELLYSLNDQMFSIYDKSLSIYQKNFLDRTNLIMGLFSGDGGRFILYRAGQPPLEAEPPPSLYRVAKSVGHSAMATFDLLAPYIANPSADLIWLPSLKSYRNQIQTSIGALDKIDIKKEDRDILRVVLKQITAFMDTCIKNNTYTYDELQTFARTIKPDLAKLIDMATNVQVGHWWKVLERWKQLLGKDWNQTYGLSNTIYVAHQNNILFSILVQFFGEEAINDRLILMETTDFTTTPESMLTAFTRIVSDRMIGEIFFKNEHLMDYELLGGSARKVIEAEAAKRGVKAALPPLVPYNSHEWPWKTDPSSGTGPATMDEIH